MTNHSKLAVRCLTDRYGLCFQNKIVNTFFIDRPETIKDAHAIAKKFYADHQMKGHPGHEITAIGNCHIDTAWLWPYDETKRKAARLVF